MENTVTNRNAIDFLSTNEICVAFYNKSAKCHCGRHTLVKKRSKP